MRSSVIVLGVPVDDVTMADAVDDVAQFVTAGRRSGSWYQVTTVNLDFLTNAVRDRALLPILQRSSLSIPDGMPIIWAARLLRSPLQGRVAGADLVEALTARAAACGWTIYLFGAAPGVAEQAARLLGDRHPGARVIGDSGPRFADVDAMDPAALDRIRAADPDILLVALGNPKQERWIQRYATELAIPVLIGVGGTFDFIVGRRRRAPEWMQRLGLEWLYRTLQEPARLGRRYAKDAIVCGPRLLGEVWRERRTRGDERWSPAEIHRAPDGGLLIRAHRCLDLRRDIGLAHAEIGRGQNVVVDVSTVERPDRRTVASLVAVARSRGGPVRLVGLGTAMRRQLRQDGVSDLVAEDIRST